MTDSPDKEFQVIDFHIHIGLREHFNPAILQLFGMSNPVIQEQISEFMKPQNIVSMLDNYGVSRAVVLAEDSPKVTGVVPNEFVAEFCSQYPERLIPFASVDPTGSTNPAKRLEQLVADLGMRGLKLYPSYQYFFPNAYQENPKMKKLRKVYECAERLRLPVMFHTGTSVFPGARLKYSNPLFLDDLAVDFPDLKIIMAHGGRGPWFSTAFYLARIHPNVFIDVSGLPSKNLLNYFPKLESISHKVLFGSDWPDTLNIGANIEAVKQLAISDKAKSQILGDNAVKILGF